MPKREFSLRKRKAIIPMWDVSKEGVLLGTVMELFVGDPQCHCWRAKDIDGALMRHSRMSKYHACQLSWS